MMPSRSMTRSTFVMQNRLFPMKARISSRKLVLPLLQVLLKKTSLTRSLEGASISLVLSLEVSREESPTRVARASTLSATFQEEASSLLEEKTLSSMSGTLRQQLISFLLEVLALERSQRSTPMMNFLWLLQQTVQLVFGRSMAEDNFTLSVDTLIMFSAVVFRLKALVFSLEAPTERSECGTSQTGTVSTTSSVVPQSGTLPRPETDQLQSLQTRITLLVSGTSGSGRTSRVSTSIRSL